MNLEGLYEFAVILAKKILLLVMNFYIKILITSS